MGARSAASVPSRVDTIEPGDAAAVAAANDASRTAGLDELRRATDGFKKARQATDTLNRQQAVMVAELKAAGRTSAEIETAVTRFVGRHRTDYARLEQTARSLAGLMDDAARTLAHAPSGGGAARGINPAAIARGIASDALHQLPALADTRVGAKVLADQVDRAGRGQPSFLGELRTGAQTLHDGKQLLDDVATATVSAVATRSLDLARAGDAAGAGRLLQGLKKLEGPVFGTQGAVDGLIDQLAHFEELRRLPAARQSAALQAWTRSVKGQLDGLSGALSPGTLDAFKGLGLVLGAVGSAQNLSGFTDQSLKNQLRTVSDGLDFSVDAGASALKVFKNAESAFLETAGRRLPLVGAVFDGLDAFNALRSGNYVGAGASTALAVGAVLTASGVAAPVGIALMAAGGVVKLVSALFGRGEGDEAFEHAIQQGYLDAGVPRSVATALDVLNGGHRVIGPFLTQLGGDARGFLERLAAAAQRDPDVVEDFRKMVQKLQRDDQGRVPTRELPVAGGARGGVFDTDTPDHPRTMPNALAWLRKRALV